MRLYFDSGISRRKGRSTDRSAASLLVFWVVMVALVIYQMPAFAGTSLAMPMPMAAMASAVEEAAPCDTTDHASDKNMPGMVALPDAGMPCCNTSDAQGIDEDSCPLMGGCFSMCASTMPTATDVRAAGRVAEHLLFADKAQAPQSVPPLQRPPRHL
ncbi:MULTISPECIES: hypothetical protein [Azospirillum]|uniref:Uncharacterized protein n=1 Tax=Azospirillum brasilense TaxID=192 RepID=A0A6L3B2I0_AZOBR|nr:hypothetical protein [Azospirillum brasilense]KAA0686141.1 hypothetical protein DS837_10590 [Azospirillum brasilense]